MRKLKRFDQILEAKQHRTGVLKADLNLGKDLIDPKSGTPVKADAIDQSHSHFVMVDTGSNKEYFTSARSRGRGGEIIPRARLEKSVSEKLLLRIEMISKRVISRKPKRINVSCL